MLFEKFYDAGAGVYDQNFGRISREFVPRLLEAARVAPGQRVLDIAAGTGIAAEIAAEAVGPSGHVVAADISRPMLDRARERLGRLANTSVSLEDGQALTLPDESFDAVLCNLGLMLFPDPARGLSEFRRVLREGGRAAVSVNTTPERSFAARINVAIGHHMPSRAAPAAHYFSLGDPTHLRGLFRRQDSGRSRSPRRRGATASPPSTPTSSPSSAAREWSGRNMQRSRRTCAKPSGRTSGANWRATQA